MSNDPPRICVVGSSNMDVTFRTPRLPRPGETVRYDIRIKEFFRQGDTLLFRFEFDGTIAGRKAVMGALQLYLDFINIFLFLLRFMGDRR